MRTRLAVLVPITLVALTLVPAAAHAAGTTFIDFESIAPAQVILDQFAASGVIFLPRMTARRMAMVANPRVESMSSCRRPGARRSARRGP